MKKTLVAIAALTAVSAFAQSTVTLSGNLDVAGAHQTGSQPGASGTTFTTTNGTASTSVINLDAVEDLGNGTKVKVHYGLDPRTLANDSLGTTQADKAASANVVATGLARDEVYVGVASGFGEIKLGAPNSIGLNVFQAASPLGTGVGSGYAPNAGTFTNSIVNTRYNRSARFDSAPIAGMTASVLYAPGNDQAITTTTYAPLQIQNARQTTELGLKYANGPLNVAVVNIRQGNQGNKTGWYAGAYTDVLDKTSTTVFGANYNVANTTAYFGYNTGDRLAPVSTVAAGTPDGTAVKSKGYRYAVKQTVGQIDLIAQYSTQTAKGPSALGEATGADAKAKVTGLRGDYNLSKTAVVYAGYEKWQTGVTAAEGTSGATVGTSGDRKIVSIGLRKSF